MLVISPGGLEQFFRSLGELTEPLEPERLAALAAPYDCDADPEATFPLIERHGLSF